MFLKRRKLVCQSLPSFFLILLTLVQCCDPSHSADDIVTRNPTNLTSDSMHDFAVPNFDIDEEGNLHLVYVRYLGNEEFTTIYAEMSRKGKWGVPIEISGSNQWSALPQIRVVDNETLFSTWEGGEVSHIYSNERTLGSVWTGPNTLFSGPALAPSITVDFDSKIHVVCEGPISGLYRVITDGVPSEITPLESKITNHSTSISSDGQIYLSFETSQGDIALVNTEASDTWSEPVVIFSDFGNPIGPEICVDPVTNKIHIAWRMTDTHKILTTSYNEGITSRIDTLPGTEGTIRDLRFEVISDTKHFVWSSSISNLGNDIYYQAQYEDGAWSERINVSNSAESSVTPAMKMHADVIYIFWKEKPLQPNMNGEIYYSILNAL